MDVNNVMVVVKQPYGFIHAWFVRTFVVVVVVDGRVGLLNCTLTLV